LAFADLVMKFPDIQAVLTDENLQWDEFLEYLKKSTSEPTAANKTHYLHSLFKKFCEPTLLSTKKAELDKYNSQMFDKMDSEFMESDKASTLVQKMFSMEDKDEQTVALKNLFKEYRLEMCKKIVHDGVSSLMGTTIDKALDNQNTTMKDMSTLNIIAMSNQTNGREAFVQLATTNQDAGWNSAKKRKDPSGGRPDPPGKRLKPHPPKTPIPPAPLKPPKSASFTADYICGICRGKGYKTIDCPKHSQSERDSFFKARDERKAQASKSAKLGKKPDKS